MYLVPLGKILYARRGKGKKCPNGHPHAQPAHTGTARPITPPLLRGHQMDEALLLGVRLQQRDAEKSARVTSDLREAIVKLTNLATSLQAANELAEGKEPTEKRVYALLSLYQRWWLIGRDHRSDPAPTLALVQRACGAVLQSAAHGSLKGVATKALTKWSAPPEVKRPREEVVEWDDDL